LNDRRRQEHGPDVRGDIGPLTHSRRRAQRSGAKISGRSLGPAGGTPTPRCFLACCSDNSSRGKVGITRRFSSSRRGRSAHAGGHRAGFSGFPLRPPLTGAASNRSCSSVHPRGRWPGGPSISQAASRLMAWRKEGGRARMPIAALKRRRCGRSCGDRRARSSGPVAPSGRLPDTGRPGDHRIPCWAALSIPEPVEVRRPANRARFGIAMDRVLEVLVLDPVCSPRSSGRVFESLHPVLASPKRKIDAEGGVEQTGRSARM